MTMILMSKQTQDKHGLWRGCARPNSFEVTSKDAILNGVDSSFSCGVRIQQADKAPLVFRISQDLHEVGNLVIYQKFYFIVHCSQGKSKG